MANLAEVSNFDSVYQLEIVDRVVGGPGGTSNRQAQELANRTKYLKDALEALEGSGGPFDYDASGGLVPAPGSGSGLAGAIQRKDQFIVSVAGVVGGVPLQVGDSLLAKQDLPTLITHYVVLQGNASLATSTVLGLVKLVQVISGGASAEQTLSITGLLNLFAQLASPDLTGNPTTPTQAPGSNNTRIANTAFVKAAVDIEITARTNADNTLQSNIDAANTARANAITTEANSRASADSTLQSNIDAANVARANAITAEASSRVSADNTLQSNIDAANTARANAITTEANSRSSADIALQNAIDAEALDRSNADFGKVDSKYTSFIGTSDFNTLTFPLEIIFFYSGTFGPSNAWGANVDKYYKLSISRGYPNLVSQVAIGIDVAKIYRRMSTNAGATWTAWTALI